MISDNEVVCVACILSTLLGLTGLAVGICLRSWFNKELGFQFFTCVISVVISLVAASIMGNGGGVNITSAGYMAAGTVMTLGFGIGFLCLGLLLGRLPGDGR